MSQPSQFGMQSTGPADGVAVAARVNGSLNALLSSHSGSTAPGYAVAGTRWLDTANASAWAMKIYDGTDWHTEWVLNPTTNLFTDVATAPGRVVQSVVAQYTAYSGALTAAIPLDDTIPQIFEGLQIFTASITPKAATNKIRITLLGHFLASSASGGQGLAAIFAGSVSNALVAGVVSCPSQMLTSHFSLCHEHTPGATTPITFSVRAGPDSPSFPVVINGSNTARRLGGAAKWVLLLEEIQS